MKVDLRISHVLVNPVNFVAMSRTAIRKTSPMGFIRIFFLFFALDCKGERAEEHFQIM